MSHTISPRLVDALTEAYAFFHAVRWRVEGSAALVLRGAPITPHDLDISIHLREYYRVRNGLISAGLDLTPGKSKLGDMTLTTMFAQMPTEIIFEDAWDGRYNLIPVGDLQVPVATMQRTRDIYERTGRTEKLCLLDRLS